MAPSVATAAVVFSQLCVLSDTYASTAAGVAPDTLMLTLVADPPVLMAMTAMVPSTFLNAAVRTPLGAVVPTRMAPGLT